MRQPAGRRDDDLLRRNYGQWHNRGYMVPETGVVGRHLGSAWHSSMVSQLLESTGTTSCISNDLDWFLDGATDRIKRLRRFPTYHADRAVVSYQSLEIFIDTGNAPIVGAGSDPQMMLRISNDGGRVWKVELWRSMGKRASIPGVFDGLGRLDRHVSACFEVSSTEPVKQPWLSAYVECAAVTP